MVSPTLWNIKEYFCIRKMLKRVIIRCFQWELDGSRSPWYFKWCGCYWMLLPKNNWIAKTFCYMRRKIRKQKYSSLKSQRYNSWTKSHTSQIILTRWGTNKYIWPWKLLTSRFKHIWHPKMGIHYHQKTNKQPHKRNHQIKSQ